MKNKILTRRNASTFAFFLAGICVAIIASTFSHVDTTQQQAAQTQQSPQTQQLQLLPEEKRTIEIYEKVCPSVVNVMNIQIRQDFWQMSASAVPSGTGSGFVWDEWGYVVTNYHVVEGGDHFLISFQGDETQYEASIWGVAPTKDIAVLKLKKFPKKITTIPVGNSSGLKVGQKVMAIGNPFGLDHTLTGGLVSALGRQMEGVGGVKIYDMIQTDASINQGNSGGPLLNSSGQLIGMNTMIFSPSGASAGLGFAVPVDTISTIVPQLIKHRKLIRPTIGIIRYPYGDLNEKLEIKKGLPLFYVIPNGPADRAGLVGIYQTRRIKLGDILLSINEHPINSFDDYYNLMFKYQVGDTVKVKYLRKSTTMEASIVLGEGED